MANILAFAESRNGELRKVALEAVTAARKLADATGGEVHALLAGAPGVAAKAEQDFAPRASSAIGRKMRSVDISCAPSSL